MQKSVLTLALLGGIAVFHAPAAHAQTVDAPALTQQLRTYFGKTVFEKNVLSVSAQGNAYRLTLDVKPLADVLGYDAKRFRMAPWSFELTPKADGTFLYKAADLPPIQLVLPTEKDEADVNHDVTFRNYRAEGVFDPKLYTFSSYKDAADAINFVSKNDKMSGSGVLNGWSSTLQAVPAANGVTSILTQGYASQTQDMSFTDDEGKVTTIKFNVGPGTADGQVTNGRNREFMDIWAYLVSNVDAKKKATPEQKKALIAKAKAAMPLWDKLAVKGDARNISVEAPFGQVKMDLVKAAIDMTGLQTESGATLLYSFEGMTIPADLLPSWAGGFLPTIADIHVGIRAKDLDKTAMAALDAYGMLKEGAKTDALDKKFKAMLLAGNPTVTLPKGRLIAPAYNFTYEGEIRLTEAMPHGTVTVTAKDFDATIAALQKAAEADPSLGSYATTAVMAKAFAKPVDGGLSVWVLMLDDKGMMSVNGQKLGPMGKEK